MPDVQIEGHYDGHREVAAANDEEHEDAKLLYSWYLFTMFCLAAELLWLHFIFTIFTYPTGCFPPCHREWFQSKE